MLLKGTTMVQKWYNMGLISISLKILNLMLSLVAGGRFELPTSGL